MKKIGQKTALYALIFSLTACGGGGGGSPSSQLTPTSSAVTSKVANSSASAIVTTMGYTLKITPFAVWSMLSSGTAVNTAASLTAANLAVVVVDLSGKVLEKVAATDINKSDSTTWSITLAGELRADRLIVVDVSQPIRLAVGDNVHQAGYIYAPTTDTYVDINIGSTAAYQYFMEGLGGMGSFVSQNVDPSRSRDIKAIENLVDNLQDLVEYRFNINSNSVEGALAELKAPIGKVITQELLNLKHPATGTAVSLVRDEGGMYTYDAAYDDEISYSALVGMADSKKSRFIETQFVQLTAADNTDDLFVLSSDGWVEFDALSHVVSYNEDASVTTQSNTLASYKSTLVAQQVIDLSGRNINDFVSAESQTQALSSIIDPSKTFASGAKAYRLTTRYPSGVLYSLDRDTELDEQGRCAGAFNYGVPITALGGNCNVSNVLTGKGNMQEKVALTELTNIFSADVMPTSASFKAMTIWGASMSVQLVNDSTKTARLFSLDEANLPILSGTGTWSKITLPYLTQDATAIRVQITNDIDSSSELRFFMVKQAGFVRLVFDTNLEADGVYFGSSFNGIAHSSIIGALNSNNDTMIIH